MSNRFSGLAGISNLANSQTSLQAPGEAQNGSLEKTEIPLGNIRTNDQVRKWFDPVKLEQLAVSIRTDGIIEPLVVRSSDGNGSYELIAGERRFRAAKLADLTKVPVVILQVDDQQARRIRAIENLQREDLNPLEETESILEVLADELETTPVEAQSTLYRMANEAKGNANQNVLVSPQMEKIKQVFDGLGRMTWQSFVSTRLPLLKLPEDVLEALGQGKIEFTKAQAIAKIKDEQFRANLLTEAVDQGLSLSQIKDKVAHLKSKQRPEEEETETPQKKLTTLTKRIRKAQPWKWEPKTRKKYEKLIGQLTDLLAEAEEYEQEA